MLYNTCAHLFYLLVQQKSKECVVFHQLSPILDQLLSGKYIISAHFNNITLYCTLCYVF